MKMLGYDVSMASILAAAAAAAASNTSAATSSGKSSQGNNNQMPSASGANLGFHMSMPTSTGPASLQSNSQLQQELASVAATNQAQAAALAAAALKYNSFYNSLQNQQLQQHANSLDMMAGLSAAQKQQQLQQNYSASLAKFMSFCYNNKSNEYIQRLMAEQQQQQQQQQQNFAAAAAAAAAVAAAAQQQQQAAGSSLMAQLPLHLANQQRLSNFRYHPYMKNATSASNLNNETADLLLKQQMTIMTSGLANQVSSSGSSSSQLSPYSPNYSKKSANMSLSLGKKQQTQHHRQMSVSSPLNASRSPSPVDALSPDPTKHHNNNETISSASPSSMNHNRTSLTPSPSPTTSSRGSATSSTSKLASLAASVSPTAAIK